MEHSRNKRFLSFRVCAVLSGVMESCAGPLRPVQDVNRRFVHRIYSGPISHVVRSLPGSRIDGRSITVRVLESPVLCFNNGPEARGR